MGINPSALQLYCQAPDPSAADVGEISEPPSSLTVTLPVTRQGTSKGHQKVNNKKESKEMNKTDV